jgi:tetratricopeptide (TPR) repeat protein
MIMLKKTSKLLLVFMIICFHAVVSDAGNDRFEQAKKFLEKGTKTYNEQQLKEAKEIFIQLREDNPSDFEYAHYIALAYLGLCDLKNFEIEQSTVKKVKKALKVKRVAIAEEGLPFADKSIELNDNFSESYRVRGALISNKISGMFSGMKNGSLAEEAIDLALVIDENNPMALIENARMYINKPGILGGDVNKGIEIIKNVLKDNPELEKGYVNLGLAYIENVEIQNAINIFKRLLEINPDNPEALFFLDKLKLIK